MTDPIERFSAESLLLPDVGARVLRPDLATVGVHWHDYYELSLVLSGEAEHVVNGEVHHLRPGSGFLLSPADFHAMTPAGNAPLTCYNVVIDSALMERRLGALGAPGLDGFPWLLDDLADLEPDFRRLQAEVDDTRLGAAQMTEALVGCLVVDLARRRESTGPRPAAPPGAQGHLRGAVLYIDRHFREPLTLADVAAQAHLSPNYFSEQFRAYTGTSFQAYLQERRLRFARSLLASTGLSVTEVCHAAGFNDLSHFGRAFRRRYGSAPSRRRGTGAPVPAARP